MKTSKLFKNFDKKLEKKASGTVVVIVLAGAILTLSTLFYMHSLERAARAHNAAASEFGR